MNKTCFNRYKCPSEEVLRKLPPQQAKILSLVTQPQSRSIEETGKYFHLPTYKVEIIAQRAWRRVKKLEEKRRQDPWNQELEQLRGISFEEQDTQPISRLCFTESEENLLKRNGIYTIGGIILYGKKFPELSRFGKLRTKILRRLQELGRYHPAYFR